MNRTVIGTRPRFAIALVAFVAFLAVVLVGWINALSYLGVEFPDRAAADLLGIVYDIGGGLTFAGVGFAVWLRRAGNLTGPLMVLIGVTLLAPILEWVPAPPLVTLGQITWGAPPVLIGALLLIYPNGTTRSRPERAWLGVAAAFLALGFLDALVTPIGKWQCPDCHSWITLSYNENLSNDVWLVKTQLLGILGLALAGLLVRRWFRASPPLRRLMAPLWIAGVAYGAVVITIVILDTSDPYASMWTNAPNFISALRVQIPDAVGAVMPYVATAAIFLIPLALLWGQVRTRFGRVAVSLLAIELSRATRTQSLVDTLRKAVGDPSLAVGLWSRPAGAYVTPEGLPMQLPDGGDRAVTRLDTDDGPLAAMIHDPALTADRTLIEGVGAVARLALENERLHAEVKAQLEEVRASRQRIVSAADEERRRVERDIHDGAQQRLVSLSMALRLAQAKAADVSPDVASTLADAEMELKQAIAELRELARGIHPAILTEAGLGPALRSLAEHAPMPVTLETNLNGRLPPVVEATAYFVAAEALTNVAKHGDGTAATLQASVADGRLRLVIADGGPGGADPSRGSGLRGLMDRVAALGGSLRLAEAPEGGTRLEAEIPCA